MSKQHNSVQTDALELETIFSLLSDDRRRDVLSFLSEQNTSVPLQEIADAVAAGQTSIETEAESSESRDCIGASLHHVHLPKLDDADVVSYDAETNTVTPERVHVIAPYLVSESSEA